MVKKAMILSWVFFSALYSVAQIYNPVSWSFSFKQIDHTTAEVVITAKIEKGWHLYSQHLPSDQGPLPTTISFDNVGEGYELIGKVEEGASVTEYDPNFQMDLNYFKNEAVFKQKVKLGGKRTAKVMGNVYFMVCDDEKCLPPETEVFELLLELDEDNAKAEKEEQTFSNGFALKQEILEPVSWKFSAQHLERDQFELQIEATIDEHWHVYSTTLAEDAGPLPTNIRFEPNSSISWVDELKEGSPIQAYDPVFESEVSYFEGKAVFKRVLKVTGKELPVVKGALDYMVCDSVRCIMPDELPFEIDLSDAASASAFVATEEQEEGRSLWAIFIAGFLGGFLALLTPCVFPMIPLTVSFFTKQSKDRAKGIFNGVVYGISIVLIYVVLAYGVTIVFGADALNALSTNVWFNLIFFVLFVIFAVSFFGAFEIQLPTSWVNKADRAADRGGLIGIFFMAFTLSLVSFSCTGPIIGTLLVEAAVSGGFLGPVMGMTGFSLALALPFALFAAFPGWLNTLPKSGGWLNSVKVALGFLELALALKFLSNADLVVQAGLLTRELFIGIWVAIFGTLSLYLLGFIKLPHDSEMKYLSVPRLFFALLSLIFTIYLIPGLWGAPLKIISGFPPPMFYSESPNGIGGKTAYIAQGTSDSASEVAGDPAHCPHGLNCFHDYDEGMEHAKKTGKPVMLDFTGWACVNCRKMEEYVWSDPKVLEILRNDVVLISLYVDEKTELPKEEQTTYELGGKKKKIRTIGNKWSYFQTSRYKTNSQPYYVLIDHEEKLLNSPTAYDPDVDKFVNWLKVGISQFNP